MYNVLKKNGAEKRIVSIPMDMIAQNPDQPRKYFDEKAMEDLKNSIREFGLIQPITVRRKGSEYELIAGERRFRACDMLGYEKIPAIILDTDSKNSALLSLLENLHREDLSFFEIAQSYENLIHNKGMSELETSVKTGKSRINIINKIRLLKLSPFVKKLVRKYDLSESHAKALLRISDEKQQLSAAQRICLNGLNINQTYDLIDSILDTPKQKPLIHTSAISDMKVFRNTVRRALDIVKNTGIDTRINESSFDWGTEYIIQISNKGFRLPQKQSEESIKQNQIEDSQSL